MRTSRGEFTLDGLVARAGRRWPDAPAVLTSHRELTYAELDRLAGHVAADLSRLGIGPGALVGIAMRKGWEQIVGVLGVLRSGAAYLPVDPDLPAERVRQLVNLSGCAELLTQPDLLPTLNGLTPARVSAVTDDLRGPAPPVRATATGVDLAYVLFTSGSTGVPKGVMVEHRNAINTVRGLAGTFGVGPGDRILSVSSLSFDPSVFDIFGVLAAGGAVVLPDPALAHDAAHWAELMVRHGVTLWNSVPSLLAMLLTAYEEDPARVPAPLRLTLLGGEAMSLDLPTRLRKVLPGSRLVNVYGPTEASICSTYFVVEDLDPTWTTIPCGHPLPSQRIVVVDERLRPIPAGTPGEICIAGDSVARGYLNDVERTRAAFVADPGSGRRMYRTGDRGRLTADGSLEFLGRDDLQVKVRGHRIELGEIESALRTHPGVADAVAVVTGSGDRAGLAAFALPERGARLARGDLVAALRIRLPHYLVPDHIRVVDAVPRTRTGKVDRNALRAIAEALAGGEMTGDPPRAGLEERLASVLGEVLGRLVPSRIATLSELGGNSLIAAQIVARLRRVLAVDLTAGFVLEHPTVADMARALAALPERAGDREPAPRHLVDRAAPARVSFGQEQVWFLDRLVGGNRAYHAQCSVRFLGRLEPRLLREALTEVVRRHEILRTTFHDGPDGPVQVVRDPAPVPLPLADLRHLAAAEREPALDREIWLEADRSFDLGRGPLVRWRLVRVADDDWTLIHTEHHLVHDGWSAAVLWREIQELYAAGSTGRPPRLPDLPVQFRDIAAWQRERYSGERRAAALAYWRRQLAGVQPADLAVAGSRPARQTFVGAALRVEVPTGLYSGLRAMVRDEGCSLFTAMFAAFTVVLHRYCGERDLCVGAWLANREREETANLIGMMVNMVALRVRVTSDLSFRGLVGQVRQTLLGALAHQHAPFDDVVRELGSPRDPSRNPLVQTCFSFHDSPMPDFRWPGASGAFRERHNGSAKFDVNVVVVPRAEQRGNITGPLDPADRLTLIWEYNTDLITADSARRMVDHYLRLLEAAVAQPDRPVDRLPMLVAADLAPVPPVSTVREPTPLLATGGVVAAVAHQARVRAGAVAVDAVDGRLTYGELVAGARRVATDLADLGVHPGDRVAVCLDRTSHLPVALLGVLALGAAYVPLDPDHPRRRNDNVLNDAGVEVVITRPALVDRFPGRRVLALDAHAPSGPALAPIAPAANSDAAYVIYTSGTTGRPKGVVIPHGALLNLLQAMHHLLRLGDTDALLAVTTMAFDIAALEFFLPLVTGGRLVVAPADALANGERLAALLDRSEATIAQATPMTWRMLMAVDWRPRGRFTALCGGEPFPTDLARPLADHSSACWNLYGPTETTIWSTAYRVRGDEKEIPIGRPLLNTTVRVLDDLGRPVPVGLPGELFIGGAGIALGYTSAHLTRDRFVELADGSGRVGRYYRTGDVVRRRPDGELVFLNRVDRQVKLHGFRIEPEEVEHALRECPGVRDAAVDLRGTPPRLVAYVVTGAEPVDAGALAERLPRYMLPRQIVPVPALPRSATGKLNRADLPEPPEDGDVRRSEPPASGLAGRLAVVFADVLERDRVGVNDDFFALGGHSLLAIVLVTRIRAALDVDVPLDVVFDRPTANAMAAWLAADGRG